MNWKEFFKLTPLKGVIIIIHIILSVLFYWIAGACFWDIYGTLWWCGIVIPISHVIIQGMYLPLGQYVAINIIAQSIYIYLFSLAIVNIIKNWKSTKERKKSYIVLAIIAVVIFLFYAVSYGSELIEKKQAQDLIKKDYERQGYLPNIDEETCAKLNYTWYEGPVTYQRSEYSGVLTTLQKMCYNTSHVREEP